VVCQLGLCPVIDSRYGPLCFSVIDITPSDNDNLKLQNRCQKYVDEIEQDALSRRVSGLSGGGGSTERNRLRVDGSSPCLWLGASSTYGVDGRRRVIAQSALRYLFNFSAANTGNPSWRPIYK